MGRLYQRLAPPPITVIDIIFGAFLSQAISASAQLGIADALAAGPLTKEELARRVGADPDSVARLMRLLISRGVFRRRRDGRFALNALADTLRTDSPISTRGVALLYGSPQHRANWTRLADAVRTGEPNPPKVFGKDKFEIIDRYNNFNVTPTQKMPVVRQHDDGRHLELMRWGMHRMLDKDVVRELNVSRLFCSRTRRGGVD